MADNLFKKVHLSQAHSSFLPAADAEAEDNSFGIFILSLYESGREAEQAVHCLTDRAFKSVHCSQAHLSGLSDSDTELEANSCTECSLIFCNENKNY